MIRILILSREALKEMILQTGGSDQIVVDLAASFDLAKELIESEKIYSAFFLDINLNSADNNDNKGMEIARLVRSYTKYEFTPVIMVTSMANFEMEAYRQLRCYQYILKPYIKEDVEAVISKLISLESEKHERSIIVKKDGINYKIKCDAIVYIQAVPRGVCLYLKKESMKAPYLTIVKIMEQLPKEDFIQCHRMFVVNRKYIENIDYVNRMIKMECYGETVEIGGTYKNKIKEVLSF